MLARLRTSAKFFTIGLVLGIVFAPDSGARIRERLINSLLGLLPGSRNEE